MDYPYWLSSDGDDAERAPVDPGEAEHVLEWVDEREWVVRRSADEWLAELAAESWHVIHSYTGADWRSSCRTG